MQNTEKKPFEKKSGNRNHNDKKSFNKEIDPIASKLVDVNRITKVVKGGRNMRFSALVVAGDKAGKVGVGTGKAAEVPNAIDKATMSAKKHMISIPLEGTTIPHEVIGKFGTSKVKLLPSKEGTELLLVILLDQLWNFVESKISQQKVMAQEIKSTALRQLWMLLCN